MSTGMGYLSKYRKLSLIPRKYALLLLKLPNKIQIFRSPLSALRSHSFIPRGVLAPDVNPMQAKTNAAIESYHSNLKSILHSAKERFVGRRMDWLIYHLTGDVVTHYWYNIQCKAFGFVRNMKRECIVVSTIIRANEILDSNVLICMDEGVAYVASVNSRPKVWTIHSPDSEWAQCNCPIAKEGMICKHTVKVFKMLHPHVDDGTMVLKAGTKHGVDRATPMSQSFMSLSQPSTHIHAAPDSATTCNVDDIVEDTNILVGSYTEDITCGPAFRVIASMSLQHTISHVSIAETSNPVIFSRSNLLKLQLPQH